MANCEFISKHNIISSFCCLLFYYLLLQELTLCTHLVNLRFSQLVHDLITMITSCYKQITCSVCANQTVCYQKICFVVHFICYLHTQKYLYAFLVCQDKVKLLKSRFPAWCVVVKNIDVTKCYWLSGFG